MNTLMVGAINIGLNYLFIPKYGYSMAAVTTMFSYFLLMVFNYFTVRYLLKINVLYLRMFIAKTIFTLIFFILLLLILSVVNNYLFLLTIKVFASLIWGYFVFIKQEFI